MLFNSYAFIFVFLPITLAGFFFIARYTHAAALIWLAAASLFFYGWWNPAYVTLLVISILFNYGIGSVLAMPATQANPRHKKAILVGGIGCDLALLAFYKYADFFIYSANQLGGDFTFLHIALPLGISFFTFTQIAFLLDASRNETKERNFLRYMLFVTFFPHLIAGPVLHHKEMMPQFSKPSIFRPNPDDLGIGMTLFFIGLFKKVVLADGISPYVGPAFDAVAAGQELTLFEAWGAALAFSLQLYFDFSGYSDMAIGVARMFGIRFPMNFYSPYQALNIIEFWRRWHMTLSRFLRDYLYIPLGGNRCGIPRHYVNIMITMLLGGLWHGAGWTFVIWGGLHGAYLIVNHGWHALRVKLGWQGESTRVGRAAALLLTFMAVTFAWVFFRAQGLDEALAMTRAMLGLNGYALPQTLAFTLGESGQWLVGLGVPFATLHAGDVISFDGIMRILVLLGIALLMPNSYDILRRFEPATGLLPSSRTRQGTVLEWRPNGVWGMVVALLGVAAITQITKVSEFLYFQF